VRVRQARTSPPATISTTADTPADRPDTGSSASIFTAAAQDVPTAVEVIATAFAELQATAWLVPDQTERVRVLRRVFTIMVEHTIQHGRVRLLIHLTHHQGGTVGAVGGAAVWIHDQHPLPPPPDYDQRLWQAAGLHAPRFAHLDDLFEGHHPDPVSRPHDHLAFLAVPPRMQGRGLGSRLLTDQHAVHDRAGIPAYLEAASPASRALYLRHGYQPYGEPFALPNGATFYPMWRDAPGSSPSPDAGRGLGVDPGLERGERG